MPAPSDGASLLRHLEAALGSFDGSLSGIESEFSVVAFGARPVFATFGLSHHAVIAQELLLAVGERDFAVGALGTLGRHVLEHQRPLFAGERHRLPGWNEASAIAGVLTVPDPVVEPFHATPHVDFVRLIPITDAEAAYARQHDWRALAGKLDGVDASDLFRDSTCRLSP